MCKIVNSVLFEINYTVPITTAAGEIVTFSLSTATTAITTFNVTGPVITTASQFMITRSTYAGTPLTNGIPVISVGACTAGTVPVSIANYGANSLTGTMGFYYMII